MAVKVFSDMKPKATSPDDAQDVLLRRVPVDLLWKLRAAAVANHEPFREYVIRVLRESLKK